MLIKYYTLAILTILSVSLIPLGCVGNNLRRPDAKSENPSSGDSRKKKQDPAPTGSDDGGEVDGGGEADDDDDDSTSGGPNLEEILADCGAQDVQNIPEGEPIFSKVLVSYPIEVEQNLVVSTAVVKATTTVEVTVTKEAYAQVTTPTVLSVTPSIIGAVAIAQGIANNNEGGPTDFTLVPFSKYTTLSSYPAWDGILCTLVPATGVTNERGKYKTIATFETPIPIQFSPKANLKRYDAELSNGKVLSNVKVTIQESNNPVLEGITELTGTVSVTKEQNATVTVKDENGNDVTVVAEVAFTLTPDFGSPEVTSALGLNPSSTYYLDLTKKDVLLNTVDTKSEKPVLIFKHPE